MRCLARPVRWLLFLALLVPHAALAAIPPLGDRWFGIYLNGERTGFLHVTAKEVPEGYEVTGESGVKLAVMGFSREATVREKYLLGKDLAVKSFQVDQILDGSRMKISGEAVKEGVQLRTETAGGGKTRLLKSRKKVYPGWSVNVVPLAQGFAKGRNYHLQVLDAESQKLRDITVTAVGEEEMAGKKAYHLRNDLYPMVDNDVWIDRDGNTLKESVRDGLVETVAEDEKTATRFLGESALARRDLVWDFSLIRTPKLQPEKLSELVVDLKPVPVGLVIGATNGQQVERRDAVVRVTLTAPSRQPVQLPDEERRELLQDEDRILPQHGEIVALRKSLVGEGEEPLQQVQKLVQWVAKNIEGAVTDSQSAVETLKTRKGNCQSHARLYASLARSAGIPTRFVSGLVYLPDKGFMYHSWAESWVGFWMPVDPTFGQVPADRTHIRLVAGDSPDAAASLAPLIGKISLDIVSQRP